MNNKDWFLTILKDMIKNKSTMVDLGKIKIFKNKNTLTQFDFNILISKSVFEEVLSEDEKLMLWLDGKNE